MKAKNLVTVVLLVFVAASLVALGVRRGGPGHSEQPLSDGVIAYYFHGKVRCPTCQNIESFAHEAVQSGFEQQIKDGRVQWRVVDYEQPGNGHFATEYELVAPTVVLVKMDGGAQTQWKNLMEVWDLVGDKAAMVEFVQQELRSLLAENR